MLLTIYDSHQVEELQVERIAGQATLGRLHEKVAECAALQEQLALRMMEIARHDALVADVRGAGDVGLAVRGLWLLRRAVSCLCLLGTGPATCQPARARARPCFKSYV